MKFLTKYKKISWLTIFILSFCTLQKSSDVIASTLDATWSSVTNPGSGSWTITNISADGLRMAGLSNSHFYTSTDGGSTWNDVSSTLNSITTSGFDASADHSFMLAGVRRVVFIPGPAAPSRMKYSTDYGATWSDVNTLDAKWWKGITISSNGQKIAVTADKNILTGSSVDYITYSTDGGSTWATSTSSGQKRWGPITSSSDGSIVVAGEQFGYLYISSDYGATWSQLNNSASTTWISLAASSDGSRLFGAANNGYVYTSSDTGQNWATSTSLGSSSWQSISASSDGSRVMAIDSSKVYVSKDYGSTWTEQTALSSVSTFYSGGLSSDGLTALIGSASYMYVGHFDVTAPTLSNGGPSGALSAGTESVSMELSTNESSTCKYDTFPNTAYASMSNTFTTTGGTSHSVSVSVSNGNSYTYYVRCSDASDNVTGSDFTISFSVNNPPISSRRASTERSLSVNAINTNSSSNQNRENNHSLEFYFKSNLSQGQGTNNEVRKLQVFLNNHGYPLASSGPGSPGFETNFFGALTVKALKNFQKANNIPVTGFFGPITRNLINNSN